MGRCIGIDFGTTNSVIAVIGRNGEPEIILSRTGARLTPTVVARDTKGKWKVGQEARELIARGCRRMLRGVWSAVQGIPGVKRLMGAQFQEPHVQEALKVLPQLERADNGDARVRIGDTLMSPSEIAAIVLKRLKDDAEHYLSGDDDVTEAVISVPARFHNAQRDAIKAAGKIAGMNVLRIVNEPTAAALAYGFHRNLDLILSRPPRAEGADTQSRYIAIYDLGGGTFDISIVELSRGNFRVVSTGGDTHLGGDDFDQRIVEYLVAQYRDENKIDLSTDPPAMHLLKEAAEKAKIALSFNESYTISQEVERGRPDVECEITRAEFEQAVGDLIETTLDPCRQALKDSGLTASALSAVVMVGGQTRMPLIQSEVEKFFGRKPRNDISPDEAVAIGAAWLGGMLHREIEEQVRVTDVTSLTLGVGLQDDLFDPIVPRNTPIPAVRSKIYTTVVNRQRRIKTRVLQGESGRASENRLIGEFHLTGIRFALRGVPAIEDTFSIDEDGILTVRSHDRDTGAEHKIVIENTTGLTEVQIEMLRDDMAKRKF